MPAAKGDGYRTGAAYYASLTVVRGNGRTKIFIWVICVTKIGLICKDNGCFTCIVSVIALCKTVQSHIRTRLRIFTFAAMYAAAMFVIFDFFV